MELYLNKSKTGTPRTNIRSSASTFHSLMVNYMKIITFQKKLYDTIMSQTCSKLANEILRAQVAEWP